MQPIQLGVFDGAEWPAVFSFTSSRLIRRDQAMSKVGLSVNLHIVSHSGIERIPEISEAFRLGARHSEVIDVAGEVRLSRNTDGHIIRYVVDRVCRSSIVTYIEIPVSVRLLCGGEHGWITYNWLRDSPALPCMASARLSGSSHRRTG